MTTVEKDVFADSSYWIALVSKHDQHHEIAQRWSKIVEGQIITTQAVLLETANSLSRIAWRSSAVALFDMLTRRSDVVIVPLDGQLWLGGWAFYRSRTDKAWSLTDCASFVVMQERKITDALTADSDFRQAGFRALLLEEP